MIDNLGLEEEGGITVISKRNLDRITGAGWRPVRLHLWRDESDFYIDMFVVRGKETDLHKFTGFSWSYSGEGPHGTLYLFQRIGMHLGADINYIAQLPKNISVEYVYDDVKGEWLEKSRTLLSEVID